MLDWHSCQICYPLETKILLLLFKGLPPGPLSIPLIGSCFFLKEMKGKFLHRECLELSKKYGKIFGF